MEFISPKQVVSGATVDHNIDQDIVTFLDLIADNTLGDKNDKDLKNELIDELFEEGFEIHNPSGTKKIGSKVIQQCLWRVMSKVKFLDTLIQGTGQDENTERLVTEGVMTVTERGGLGTCFSSKGGIFQNAFMYGDGLLLFGKGKNEENPVKYQVMRNEDVYADNFCYGVRGVKPANKMCGIIQFDADEAYEMYEDLEENEIYGRIPGTYHQRKDDLTNKSEEEVVELAWGYNLPKQQYIIFAGAQCYELDRFEEKEYPFIKNNKPYIPIFQFMCQPGIRSFWNHGIGEMVFDLAVIARKLLNLEVTHLEDNVLPFTFINAPQKKVDELVEKMAMANEARKNGDKPVVAMEFAPNGGNQSVGAQALITQNLFNEWNVVWDRLYRELSRLGINLDDVDRGTGFTRGQVIAEEQASNAFVQQMMNYNADETKELIECSMDGITEFVSNNNKTPLNLLTRITLPNGSTSRLDKEVTMGMLSKTLKEGTWFATVDKRSGRIPSDLTKLIYEETQLKMTPPGTPEYNELYRRIATRRGIDMTLKEPEPQGQEGAPEGGGEQPQQQIPGATQRVLPEMLGRANVPV